jgi:hypothetical protein
LKKYLGMIIAVAFVGMLTFGVGLGWRVTAEGKQTNRARVLAQDIGTHVDSINVSWGTTGGQLDVIIYGFPDAEKQAVIIDRIRMLKHDWKILEPVTVTFRAYPMKVLKPSGEEANGNYAPDEVIRAVAL